MLQLSQIAGMGLIYRMYSMDSFLDDLVRLGFRAVELWGAYPHQFISCGVSVPDAKTVRRKIESRGLRLVCYTPEQLQYHYNIASSDRIVRGMSLAYYRTAVETARALGADRMLMTSGWRLYDQPFDDAWRYSCDALTKLAAYAARQGVTLLLENLQPVESELVCSLSSMRRMLDEVGSPALMPMVDSVAMHVQGETMQQYLDAFGTQLSHVHLVDGTPTGHLAWGKGSLPLDTDVQALVDFGYVHAISFEVANGDTRHPATELACSMARMKKYLNV